MPSKVTIATPEEPLPVTATGPDEAALLTEQGAETLLGEILLVLRRIERGMTLLVEEDLEEVLSE